MYNKCDKCGKIMPGYEQRRLTMGKSGKINTMCMKCYETQAKIKKA
jgi:hypothetical protein